MKTREEIKTRGCGRRFAADGLMHLCRARTLKGECWCPCGARAFAGNAGEGPADPIVGVAEHGVALSRAVLLRRDEFFRTLREYRAGRASEEMARLAAAAYRALIIDYGAVTGKKVPVPSVAKLMRQ